MTKLRISIVSAMTLCSYENFIIDQQERLRQFSLESEKLYVKLSSSSMVNKTQKISQERIDSLPAGISGNCKENEM